MDSAHYIMENIATYRIMNAIGSDPDFTYFSVTHEFKEIEKNLKFELSTYSKDAGINKSIEIIAENEYMGKQYHKMTKNPQNFFVTLIRKKDFDKREFTYDVLYVYESGSCGLAAINLAEKVIDDFMQYKGFTTLKDIKKYVTKFENGIEERLISNM